eukprot:1196181-Prorocentrum_minimum.AAC.1
MYGKPIRSVHLHELTFERGRESVHYRRNPQFPTPSFMTLRGLLPGTPRRGIASQEARFARTDLKSGRASERGRATSRNPTPVFLAFSLYL